MVFRLSSWGAILGVVVLSLAVSGCGRRGRLEPPLDPAAAAANAEVPKSGIRKRPKNPPIRPPNDTFILDPLL